MRSTTISAKISTDLKEKIVKYRIKVSEVVRRAIQEEVNRIEDEALRERLREVSLRLKGRLTIEEVVSAVRATREER